MLGIFIIGPVYFAKPTTVDELINVVKRFSEGHRENVFHSVALNVNLRGSFPFKFFLLLWLHS